MSVYDINGNVIATDGGGSGDNEQARLTVKQNNSAIVTEFLSVAQSFLNQTSITYKDGDTIFYKSTATNGIDCSTYVGLCLMGYPFNKTPYATGNYIAPTAWVANTADYKWAIDTIRYKISRFADGSNPDEICRLACQLANWMYSRNQVVPMTNGFRDVRPGDIVFWGHRAEATGEWLHPTWFKHINHVGIILTREDAPNTFVDGNGTTRNWDKDKYPYKHTIIDVGNTTPTCRTTHWLEEGQEDPTSIYKNNVNTVVLICRPDFGAMDGDVT